MLGRKDLEGMRWNVTRKPIESRGGSNTVFVIGDMKACIYDDWRQMDERGLSTEAVQARARLLATAPALALACLDALALLEAGKPKASPRSAGTVEAAEALNEAWRSLSAGLRAALATAGIEGRP